MSAPTHQPEDGCPQCGTDADWGTSSWCPDCGYYPAVGKMVETPRFESEEQVYDNWWQAVPVWLWILAGGVGVIFITSVIGRVIFAETVRLYWSVGQMALGFIVAATCHFMAYMFGASKSDRIGPFDAFLKPFATWQPVLMAMPRTQKLLWGCTWGVSALLFGFLIVGGINLQELAEAHQRAQAAKPKKKRANPMAVIMKSATAVADAQGNMPSSNAAPESMEDALSEFTGSAGVDEDGSVSSGGESKSGPANSGAGGGNRGASMDGKKQIASGETPGGESRGQGGASESNAAGASKESPSTTSTVSVNHGPMSSSAAGSQASGSHQSGASSGRSFAGTTSDGRERLQCLVFGYTTNAQGDARSLLLAAPMYGGLRFVGKVSVDDVDPMTLSQMTERFARLQQRGPTVRSPYGGRWLKSELFCVVEFTGWSISGRLNNPYISEYAYTGAE